jgi:hypothetical protein
VSLKVCAVDWSGQAGGGGRTIWLAEVAGGELVSLQNGRGREALADRLLELAAEEPRLIVGFDFAFSLPAWFLIERGLADAPALWKLAAAEAEGWLASGEPPFWGRPGSRRPELAAHFRQTELLAPAVGGIRPKSPFQVGGAGAVGTGSLRGMAVLRRLRQAGFSIWPFDPFGWPLVVEIYPRLLTGAVSKKRLEARRTYLAALVPALPEEFQLAAIGSDDAFDAAISALAMARHVAELTNLPVIDEPWARLEGQIWWPGCRTNAEVAQSLSRSASRSPSNGAGYRRAR